VCASGGFQCPTKTVWLVAAAEPMTDVDVTAADILAELHLELQHEGITLCFAQVKGRVKDSLKQYGIYDAIGAKHFFPTIGQAVDHYIKAHPVDWVDWDEVPSPAS
jgi:MFS superfamily sulfate permease-like transporter